MKFWVAFLVIALSGVCLAFSPADINSDGFVDFGDLVLLASQWLINEPNVSHSADLNSNDTVDFVDFALFAAQWQFEPNMTFVISGMTELDGITMNGLPGNPVTTDGGLYSAVVPYGWSGTVTPTKTGYNFNPIYRTYTKVITDQNVQDYIGTQFFIISGSIGIDDVTMSGLPGDIVTTGDGLYSAVVTYGWSGTVTPIKQGYNFDPPDRSYVEVTANQFDQDYMGTLTGEDPNAIYREFNSDSNSLIFQRNSPAILEGPTFIEVPANTLRAKPVCGASALKHSDFFNYKPKAVDARRGIILCTNSRLNSEMENILYETTDGVNFQQIVDIYDGVTEPFKTYYTAIYRRWNLSIEGLAVMDDGSWLMSVGLYGAFEGNDVNETVKPSGRIYRLANPDDPNGEWTMVCNMPFGYVPEWGWQNKTGPKIVVGEYGSRLQNNNPRCIFMTEDYGATWQRIYTPDAFYGRHTHQAVFEPTSDYNTIYVSCGDLINIQCMYRLEKIDGNWVRTKNLYGTPYDHQHGYQPVGALVEGNSIYWGADESGIGATIIRHWRDGDVDNFEPVMKTPLEGTNVYTPYQGAFNKGFVFCIVKCNGVYYATVSEQDDTVQNVAGIYVSADLRNWVCAYREIGTVGPKFIAGYCNGKIWASSQELVGPYHYKQRLGFTFPPLTVKTINAMQCDRGLKNQWDNLNTSTFDLNKGNWNFYYDKDSAGCGVVSGVGLHGNSCLQFVHSGTTTQQTWAEVQSPPENKVGSTPHVGDLITYTWWMKAADSWPKGYDVSFTLNGAGPGTGIDYDGSWHVTVEPGAWRKYSLTAMATGPTLPHFGLRIWMHNNGLLPTTDAKLYIDCAQMVFSPNRFVINSNFQPGGTTRDDEKLVFPLAGMGHIFTTTFEWHPETGNKNFFADIPIAKWVGTDGNSICLYWEQQTKYIKLVDSSNSAINTWVSYPFQHNDFLRFGLVSDANGLTMYIQNTLYGILEFGNGTEIKLATSLRMLKLGINRDETDFGCGNFSNVRVWRRKLSFEEITDVFDKPEPIIAR